MPEWHEIKLHYLLGSSNRNVNHSNLGDRGFSCHLLTDLKTTIVSHCSAF